MPRTANEARAIAPYSAATAPPPPPSILTDEQKSYWRDICQDLPPGHIRSDNTPTLIESCRHLSYPAQVSESLASLRNANLTGWDTETFGELLHMAREQSRSIALLSTKLRLTNQARDNSVVAKRARDAEPIVRAQAVGRGRGRVRRLSGARGCV